MYDFHQLQVPIRVYHPTILKLHFYTKPYAQVLFQIYRF